MKKILLSAAALIGIALALSFDVSAGVALAASPTFLGLDDSQPFRRTRRDLPAFENVVASGIAVSKIPRYQKSLLAATLYLSGTTFNETHITDVRLRLGGSKTIWQATGADVRKINAYKGYFDGNRQFVWVDFSANKSKSLGGEFVGGIDMTTLPAGLLTLEVTTSGATAPALTAKGHWGPAGTGAVMQKLLKLSYSTSGTGRKVLPIDQNTLQGARLRRLYAIYAGTSWEQGTATSAAWSGNTGNGVMGTVTSTAGAMTGTHRVVIIEPGANVGTFIHFKPDNGSARVDTLNSKSGVVASAYASGGLSFTLADGATDFISGDGFDLTVSENTDGNISRIEVIKDGEACWDFLCKEARQLQKQYGFLPQSLMYVVDFEIDGWPDGSLRTADAKTLEIAATFTAADALTLYAEVLDSPANNIN